MSQARAEFLRGIGSLKEASDADLVRRKGDTGSFLRRGLTVAAFNLLEVFIAARGAELLTYADMGATQFSDLPEKFQRESIRKTLKIGAERLKYVDAGDICDYGLEIGKSLASAENSLGVHSFSFRWSGSNISTQSLGEILRMWQVQDPWRQMGEFLSRCGLQENTGIEGAISDNFEVLIHERHSSAHDSTHNVTTIWVRALYKQLMKYAIAFDGLASSGAIRLRSGEWDKPRGSNESLARSISVLFLQERAHGVALMKEGHGRAIRVGKDADSLLREHSKRIESPGVVLWRSRAGDVWKWRTIDTG